MVFCRARPSLAQQVDVDVTAVHAMRRVLERMQGGATRGEVAAMLDSVLQIRAYRSMFLHYNRSWRPHHLPDSVFRNMILSLRFPAAYAVGQNQRADQMLPAWRRFYDNPALYDANLRQLGQTDVTALLRKGVRDAQTWLPPGWTVPGFYLPIIPSGGSPAFSIDTTQGYDFFQLPRDSSGNIVWEHLAGTIAHESHHLAVRAEVPGPMSRPDSVAYEFLSVFLGEGTATKFVNAFPGGCVPSIDPGRRDPTYSGAVREWWERYAAQEPDLFGRLTTTFERAYGGALSRDSLRAEIARYWLSGFVSPVYFVGAELFGAVYHGFGREGAFMAMVDARELLPLYNAAVRRRQDILGGCPLIPDSTVEHVRAVGRH
jgi:hypothetical protein